MENLNEYLYLLINAEPDTATWLLSLATFVAKRVIYLIPLTLAVTWLLGQHEQRQTALRALFITAAALALNQLIGAVYPTPRPFELALGHNFLAHAPTPSFPSNHLTIFMCTGLSFAAGGMAATGILLLALGLVVAWARVYVGVHFPFDMVGALVISCALYVLLSPLWQRIAQPVTSFAEAVYRFIFAFFIRAGLMRR